MTVHKCRSGDEHTVPFRESKLTRLFQNYFIGKGEGIRKGKITMFVNVSNNASVFDETFHVLKFSALTSKVCWLSEFNSDVYFTFCRWNQLSRRCLMLTCSLCLLVLHPQPLLPLCHAQPKKKLMKKVLSISLPSVQTARLAR